MKYPVTRFGHIYSQPISSLHLFDWGQGRKRRRALNLVFILLIAVPTRWFIGTWSYAPKALWSAATWRRFAA